MQSIGKTPDLIFALSRSQRRLRSHVLGGRGEREVFPGGESRESCRTQGFRQDQAADASFGGRVEEIVDNAAERRRRPRARNLIWSRPLCPDGRGVKESFK